ncbi:MAG: hypothetical protein CMJ76_04115 [Planctomycetaceae bacterium]|nr:hypothetical protein [Planctomycetaceae bacterium]|tara:strand:+ start:3675 stop:4616 length:942 start_codon:yes stop_codon:yes gene_type:complete
MKNKSNLLPLLGVTLVWISLPAIFAHQPLPKTVEELQELAPKERNELQQKKVRFNQLSEEKKAEYRDFNVKLNASPNQQRLRSVMEAYTVWLLNLETDQRNRILALPLDQRLQEVVQLVKQQKEQRFKELLDTNLKHNDLLQVGQWYEGWLDVQNENLTQLAKSIEDEVAQSIIKQTKDPRQRSTVIVAFLLREQGDSKWHEWFGDWETDVTKLMGSLSETAQFLYASAESDQQRLQLVLRWGYYYFVAQSMQGISDDELLDFYKNKMSPEDREILDRQLPANVIPMLRRFYFQYRMPQVIRRMLVPEERSSE